MNFADLRRFEPFCEKWGESRGGAIDRFFIDAFLRLELKRVRGHILECGGQRYRMLVPAHHISSYDVVDLNPRTPVITICGNIQHLRTIATSTNLNLAFGHEYISPHQDRNLYGYPTST